MTIIYMGCIMDTGYLPFDPMPGSAKACREMVSPILRALPREQPLDDPLLRWLAEWSPKIGPQIPTRYFTVHDNWNHGYATLAHTDSASICFTYRDAVDCFYRQLKKGVKEAQSYGDQRISEALRRSVAGDVERWKRSCPCTMTDTVMVVDHAYPDCLEALVKRFRVALTLQERYGDAWAEASPVDVTPALIELAPGDAASRFMDSIRDPRIERQWQAFHKEHARLRWLPKVANSIIRDRDPRLHGFHDLPDGTPVPD